MSTKTNERTYGLKFYIDDRRYLMVDGGKVIQCDNQRYERTGEMTIATARKALAALSALLAAHDGEPCDSAVRIVNWEFDQATKFAEQAAKAAHEAADRLDEVSARVAVQFREIKEGVKP